MNDKCKHNVIVGTEYDAPACSECGKSLLDIQRDRITKLKQELADSRWEAHYLRAQVVAQGE
jgi:hypothetical protein